MANINPNPISKTLTQSADITTALNKGSTKNSAKWNGMTVYATDTRCPFCGQGILTTSEEEEEAKNEVKAENIITNPDRRFVSDELLEKISTCLKYYMNREDYDPDNDKLIDTSKNAQKADLVEWENVNNRPDIDINKINQAIQNSHTHINLTATNYLGINSKKEPLWNNENWPYPKTAESLPLDANYMRNIIISDSKPIDAEIGDIWLEIGIINDKSALISFNVKYIDNEWHSISVNDILELAADKIQPIIYRIFEENQITSHEDMGDLFGGDINAHYHLSSQEYTTLKHIISDYNNGLLNRNG